MSDDAIARLGSKRTPPFPVVFSVPREKEAAPTTVIPLAAVAPVCAQQREIPALQRQPTLLRILPPLVVYI